MPLKYHNIFDSHSHYDDRKFDQDRKEILESLAGHGVRAVMSVGADFASSRSTIALAQEYPFIYAAVGIHPHSAKEATAQMEEILKEHVTSTPKVKAIGEIGLDYYYDYSPRQKQKEVFQRQLVLAAELGLPVIIHSRDAHQDTFDILEKYQPQGVIHSYSGSAELAIEYEKLGFYFGFNGVLTFKNARRALEAVEVISPDRLLIETDCPYLAPAPFRGKRSDSTMLPSIVEVMAKLKQKTPQEMVNRTFENACRLYGIDRNEL